MAGAIKDFFNFNPNKNKEPKEKETYWTCPRCNNQNPLGTPFCLKCAEDEEKTETQDGKVKLEADDNPIVGTLIQALNFYLQAAQIPSKDVAEQARKMGIVVNAPQEIGLVPIKELDRLADSFVGNNRLMAVGSGALMGFPGGAFMLATIPTDVSALTYLAFRTISGIAQSYGNETRSEEGRTVAMLLFAGASGLETITVGGSQVFLSHMTRNVLTKPYRDMIMKRIVREVAKDLGLSVARQGFARLVPMLGSVVGGTTNYLFMSNVASRSKNHYRMKLLEMRSKAEESTKPKDPNKFEIGEDNPI